MRNVSGVWEPRDEGRMTASRWAAATSAVVITLMTVTGALGIGPAAALAEPPEQSSSAAGSGKSQHPEDDASAGGDEASSDDWLIYDEPENEDPPAEDPESSPPVTESTKLPARSGSGKRIVYDESAQRVWLVGRDDNVKRTYLVSGALDEDLLKPDKYHVTSKSRHAVSYDYNETMNYMVRFAFGRNSAIGFHDIPAHHDGSLAQSRDELGTVQSAGCVRQWIADARALWEFAPVGTPVIVTA